MKWIKVTIDTTTEAEDAIGYILSELGIEGIEIEDNIPLTEEEKNQIFVDILPETVPNDNSARVSFYIEPSDNLDDLMRRLREGLDEISDFLNVGSKKITVSETDDADWLNKWKEYFKPFRIDDTIVIKPVWEEFADSKPGDLVVNIDPGISFGTGSHETTKLCILGIKKYIRPGDIVLDAGSGSGILSVIARKLGAGCVLGVDIDPLATKTAIYNAGLNKIDAGEWNPENGDFAFGDIVAFATGNILDDRKIRARIGRHAYDLVAANILADIIIPLSGVIGENMKKSGIFITSGIINTKEADVKAALEGNGFDILETNRMGDWVSFAARLK